MELTIRQIRPKKKKGPSRPVEVKCEKKVQFVRQNDDKQGKRGPQSQKKTFGRKIFKIDWSSENLLQDILIFRVLIGK